MPDSRLTQPSFTAGEISPDLYSRKDLAKYQVGVRLLENMYVHPYGGVSNRPGLKFMSRVKDSTKNVRLGKFEAADDQAFLIEEGDLYFRYYYRGGAVVDGGGVRVETITPYSQTQVDDLYTAQSNDVMTLVHPNFRPYELRRTSPTVWALSGPLDFAPSATIPTGLSQVTTEGYTGYSSDHLPIAYTYRVSTLADTGEESKISALVTSDPLVFGYEKNFVTLTWTAVAGAVGYNIYKRENGVYGFIGYTDGDNTFKDTGFAPSFADGPITARDPFAAGGSDCPSVVSFCQQRRVFAATLNHPQTIYMTASGNFASMQVSKPAKDDDAVQFTLAAQKKQDIFHMVAIEKGLIVFTRSGEWRVTGRDGDVITPSSILPEPQSFYGASNMLKPIIAGEQLLFVPASERAVLEMEYSIQIDRYHANNLALLANHLFKNRSIIAWDYAAKPNGIIWCVMSDGTALSLTYLKEHDVWGWGRHTTKGKFLDVACIPEGPIDTAYFLIARLDGGVYKKNIEYLPQRSVSQVSAFYVDAGLTYRQAQSFSVTDGISKITLNAHGYSNGDEIQINGWNYLNADGDVVGSLTGRYIVSSVTTNTFIPTQDGVPVNIAQFAFYYFDAPATVLLCTDSVSGLEHLEGRAVMCLCDGIVYSDKAVTAGAVSFDRQYANIHVGLSYTSTIYTLDMVNPQANTVGIKRAIPRAFIQVADSRGFSFGPNPDNVWPYEGRTDENYDDPERLHSANIMCEWVQDWEEETAAAVIQTQPLPLTVLAFTLEENYGG